MEIIQISAKDGNYYLLSGNIKKLLHINIVYIMYPKRILNYTEAIINTKLQKVCSDWQASVHPKIQVADILSLSKSGINNDYYRYAHGNRTES